MFCSSDLGLDGVSCTCSLKNIEYCSYSYMLVYNYTYYSILLPQLIATLMHYPCTYSGIARLS